MEPSPLPESTDLAAATQRRRALASAQVGSWHREWPDGVADVDLAWCLSLDLDPCTGTDHLERWARRIHPDDAGRFQRAHAALFAAGGRGEFEVEYRLLTRDSRWLWLLQRGGITRRGADGTPIEAGGICIEIDARKRAEVETQQNESRLATALWGARAAFWQVHRPSDTAVRSPLWFAMTGYSREAWEEQPQPWLSRIHPDDQPAVQRLIAEHLDGRSQHLELEYRLRCADGSWKWLMDRGRVVEWDFDGQPVAVIGVSIDIDAQKRSETALRSTEARLETAIWGAGVGLYELDCASGITHWLNDWCARFDLDPCEGDAHVTRWDANIHPVDIMAARARFSAHLDGREEYYDAEYRIRTLSGGWRWIFERGRVVARDQHGVALRLVGTCMDIDQRKGAELVAEQSQQRLKMALESGRGCLWEWDVARQQFNDEYYLLHGVDPAEGRLDPEFWLHRVHPDDRDRVVAADRLVLGGHSDSYDAQYRIRHADGRWRWIVDRFRGEDRTDDGRARRLVGFLVDITAEVEAREAQIDIERTLAAVTAHAPASLLLLDTDARIRFINRPVLGRTIEQLLGQSLLEVVGERLAAVLGPLYAASIADGEARSAVVEMADSNGVLRVYDHRVAAVWDNDRIVGLSVSSTDVTDRSLAEEQRRAQATLLSMMREAVVLMSRDWIVRLSNPAFDAMLGAASGSLQGVCIRLLLQAAIDDLIGISAGVNAELEQHQLRGYVTREFDWRCPDGQVRRVIATFTPAQVAGEALLLAVYVDVTQERVLERRILDAAAREQRRLGAALHDGLGQELTGIALMMRSLSSSLAGNGGHYGDRLDEIIVLVNEAIDSARRLARGFAPVSSEQGGLRGALRTLVESTRAGAVKVILIDALDAEPQLSDAAATHLLRIAQEATSNALKHAGATRVRILLEFRGEEIWLTISDDGQGFPEPESARRGFGIETIRYRVEALRGQLDIDDDNGVTIRCRVPVH